MKIWLIAPAALLLTACGPRLVQVVENGAVLPDRSEAAIEQARAQGEAERARIMDDRAEASTVALASCGPSVCDAIARGELAIGMNEAQVLAATRTSYDAWDVRPGDGVVLMAVRPGAAPPRDAVGEIAYVGLQNNAVTSYTYREAQGFRVVSNTADATLAGRATARADALLQQGDEYAAAGRLDLALDRYDRADVIRPGHAETSYRIAATLDKQLRPIEAVLRYRMFIHQMELETIRARGEVAASIAEAIARAHERIIVLERR